MVDIRTSFFIENPEFSEVKPTETIGNFESIDEFEDEVWLMQCGKGMDVTKLEHQKLKLPGRTNIDGTTEAVVVNYENENKLTFGYCNRKGQYSIRQLPIRGSIVLRSHIKSKETVTQEKLDAQSAPMGREPLPEIKLRHPLLGVRFEEKLQLLPNVAERLKQAEEISQRETRSRRGKIREIGIKQEGVNTEKQKNKRKHEGKVECSSDSPTKKLKKSKKSHDDVEEDLQWLKNI